MKEIIKTNLTVDGFKLNTVIWEPEAKNSKVLVMCHGLTSHMDGRNGEQLHLAKEMVKNGFKVIRFDFRGHGKSSGTDLNINIESFINDLDCIIQNEIESFPIYLYGFSFGGFAVSEYINRTHIETEKVVLWSPALDPNGSSFEDPKTFCYREILKSRTSGSLEKSGHVLWKSKNFKVSKEFVDQVKSYDCKKAISSLPSKKTFILQGLNDKNVDRAYNERYAKEYGIKYREYEASHSLFQKIDVAVKDTVDYFMS